MQSGFRCWRNEPESGPSRLDECLDECLDEEVVLGFVEGRLAQGDIARVDAHLSRCAHCVTLVIEALRWVGGRRPGPASPSGRCLAFEPGACVGRRFRIGRSLGKGGMGDVYEAFDLELQQVVAIKTARAARCDEDDVTLRLAAEVKLARRIRHPNVCRVYDLGVHYDERPLNARLSFISMELIEGESLAQRLRRGPLTRAEFCRVGRDMLAGAAAMHHAQVIHRDIKSDNLMLRSRSGEPAAIIDFGLAVDASRAASREPESSGVFAIEGSPAYMAPEQFRDASLTPATDVFSSGVVLFQALTGVLPFRSLGPARKAGARRDPAEPALRAAQLSAGVPVCLEAFISRCLEADPERRFADASAASSELEAVLARL